MGFKEDQGRIEEGILAALDRLSQFEKAIEKSLRDKSAATKAPPKQHPAAKAAPEQAEVSGNGQTCFEIPEGATGDDIPDPLEGSQDRKPSTDDTTPTEGEELDIF